MTLTSNLYSVRCITFHGQSVSIDQLASYGTLNELQLLKGRYFALKHQQTKLSLLSVLSFCTYVQSPFFISEETEKRTFLKSIDYRDTFHLRILRDTTTAAARRIRRNLHVLLCFRLKSHVIIAITFVLSGFLRRD